MQEDTLDLRKLFWDIILKWRIIVVCAVICGIALTGFKYFRDTKTYDKEIKPNNTANNGMDIIASKLDASELTEANAVLNVYKQISDIQDFIDNSELMKIDPYKEKQLRIQYYVDVKSDDSVSTNDDKSKSVDEIKGVSLAYSYAQYVDSNDLFDLIRENTSVNLAEDDVTSFVKTETVEGTSVFSITIICTDEMNIDKIADGIDNLVMNKAKELNKIANHEVIKTGSSISVEFDRELANVKNTYYSQISTLQASLSNIESRLSSDQKTYIKSFSKSDFEDGEEEKSETKVKVVKPGVSKKYALVGIVLGVLLACGWIIFNIVVSSKLVDAKDFEDRNKITIVGIIPKQINKKKIFGFVDNWIIRTRDRNKKSLSSEQKINGVVTGIAIQCMQKEINKVIITGTEIERIDKATIEAVIDGLEKKNINAIVVNDIVYDDAALTKSVDTGDMIVLEQCGLSIKAEIDNQIKKAEEYKINILGAIIIE